MFQSLSIYQTWKLVNVIGKIGQICRIFKGNECSYIEICVNISYKLLDLLFYWQNLTFIGISAYMMEPLLDHLLSI